MLPPTTAMQESPSGIAKWRRAAAGSASSTARGTGLPVSR